MARSKTIRLREDPAAARLDGARVIEAEYKVVGAGFWAGVRRYLIMLAIAICIGALAPPILALLRHFNS